MRIPPSLFIQKPTAKSCSENNVDRPRRIETNVIYISFCISAYLNSNSSRLENTTRVVSGGPVGLENIGSNGLWVRKIEREKDKERQRERERERIATIFHGSVLYI